MKITISFLLSCTCAVLAVSQSPAPRYLDEFSSEMKVEDGVLTPAAPQCEHGWHYYNGHCYYFSSVHTVFMAAEEKCNAEGAILAEVYDEAENNYIKTVLLAINPKDGTDYFLGAIDFNRDKNIHWMSGHSLTFTDWKNDAEPAGAVLLHMNYDNDFQWDTKNSDDQDNGFICKKKHTA